MHSIHLIFTAESFLIVPLTTSNLKQRIDSLRKDVIEL